MTRRSVAAGVLAFVLTAVQGTSVHAQWGYPGGFGGFGWGGWGASSLEGDVAMGMGAFAAGAGFYNLQTAQADAINTDTVMRWNQSMYQAQQNSLGHYAARLKAEHARNLKDRAAIHDRLRNNPSTRDITDGDALDVLLDDFQNNAVSATTIGQIKTPLAPALIAEIPFEYASEGMTICLNRMTLDETWPLALRVEAFRPGQLHDRRARAAKYRESALDM